MALTTGQQVRLKIQDAPVIADDILIGDSQASAFALPHRNITSGTAYLLGTAGAWSATQAAFDASGTIVASGVISALSGLRVRYVHSTFSDDEIGNFTAVGGTVVGAALEAVEALMFDGLRRARWMAPDGSQYDDTMAMGHLIRMHSAFKADLAEEAIDGGGFQSWSLEQQNYP